jgi:DNA-binding response OmpR family regulator
MKMASELILIVDDNPDVRIFVRTCLEAESFKVVEAADGLQALDIFRTTNPAVVILDLAIGQPDGFEVCREIRKESAVPIVMLTNRVEEVDEAMCLAAGADDYITKPVSPRILALRVTNQLRHRGAQSGPTMTTLTAHNLVLDIESREFQVAGKQIPLTRTEFDFLRLLMTQPRRVFTREQVLDVIGSSAEFSSDHLLDTHASRLRIKIREAGGSNAIGAVRGVGYRLFSV